MKDILISLLEEPSKIKKIFLNLVEIILVSVITSTLYIEYFGAYDLILPTDENFLSELYEFVISGRAILVIFLYLFAKYMTAIMLIIFPLSILGFISNRFHKKLPKNKVIFMTAIMAGAMKIILLNLKTSEVHKGPKFKEYYKRLQVYTKFKIERELSDWKNSFISDVFLLYSVFVYVYFFVLELKTPWALDFTIIAVLIIFICIFTLVHIYVSFVRNHKKEILEFFTLVKQVHHTKSCIVKHKIKILHQIQKTNHQNMTFTINSHIFHVYNLNASALITINYVQKIIDKHQGEHAIILSPLVIPKKTQSFVDQHSQITYIRFSSKKKLYKALENYFKNSIKLINLKQKTTQTAS